MRSLISPHLIRLWESKSPDGPLNLLYYRNNNTCIVTYIFGEQIIILVMNKFCLRFLFTKYTTVRVNSIEKYYLNNLKINSLNNSGKSDQCFVPRRC